MNFFHSDIQCKAYNSLHGKYIYIAQSSIQSMLIIEFIAVVLRAQPAYTIRVDVQSSLLQLAVGVQRCRHICHTYIQYSIQSTQENKASKAQRRLSRSAFYRMHPDMQLQWNAKMRMTFLIDFKIYFNFFSDIFLFIIWFFFL